MLNSHVVLTVPYLPNTMLPSWMNAVRRRISGVRERSAMLYWAGYEINQITSHPNPPRESECSQAHWYWLGPAEWSAGGCLVTSTSFWVKETRRQESCCWNWLAKKAVVGTGSQFQFQFQFQYLPFGLKAAVFCWVFGRFTSSFCSIHWINKLGY